MFWFFQFFKAKMEQDFNDLLRFDFLNLLVIPVLVSDLLNEPLDAFFEIISVYFVNILILTAKVYQI